MLPKRSGFPAGTGKGCQEEKLRLDRSRDLFLEIQPTYITHRCVLPFRQRYFDCTQRVSLMMQGGKVGVGGDNGHERYILEGGIDGSTEQSDSRSSDRLARGCRTTSAVPDGTRFRGVARGSPRRREPCREIRLLHPRPAKGTGGPRVGHVSGHR